MPSQATDSTAVVTPPGQGKEAQAKGPSSSLPSLPILVLCLLAAGIGVLAIAGAEGAHLSDLALGIGDTLLTIAASLIVVNYLLAREQQVEKIRRGNLCLFHIIEECHYSAAHDERFLAALWGPDFVQEQLETPRFEGRLPSVQTAIFNGTPSAPGWAPFLSETAADQTSALDRIREEVRTAQDQMEGQGPGDLDKPYRTVRGTTYAVRAFAKRPDPSRAAKVVSIVVLEHWTSVLALAQKCAALSVPPISASGALFDQAAS